MAKPAGGPRVQKKCKECGAPFEVPHFRAQTASFCSATCRNKAGAAAVRVERQCPCGTTLPPLNVSHAKFCSDECRVKHGQPKGRRTDPANHVVFDCETCGRTVTRYKNYGNGANRFCSNLCAVRHTKKVHHVVVDGQVFDSSWEVFVYVACKVAKIAVERVEREEHGIEFEGRFYAPDLYLPKYDVYIEVKGRERPADQAKWSAFRSAGRRLIVVGDDIIELSPVRLRDVVRTVAAAPTPTKE